MSSESADNLIIGGEEIEPGARRIVKLAVAPLYTHSDTSMPVHVIRGRTDGPRLFVCSAVHGDEINGVEIIRRLLRQKALRRIKGTLIAVPIVNVYGYLNRTRYLPDRRDLNRSFPGSPTGSMASRLAHQFVTEIVDKSTHGIDLHTGAIHRTNLPQVRISLDHRGSRELAHAFRVPLIMDASIRDGSLREIIIKRDIPILVYEGGEALRFDEGAIRAGLKGVMSVMREIGMLPARKSPQTEFAPLVATGSHWVRAPQSGTLIAQRKLGDLVEADSVIGIMANPITGEEVPVKARRPGVIIGQTRIPLVYEGEAMFNIAHLEGSVDVVDTLDEFNEELGDVDTVEGAV